MPPGRFQGCRKGVFGLDNWDPLRQPNSSRPSGGAGEPSPQEVRQEESRPPMSSNRADFKTVQENAPDANANRAPQPNANGSSNTQQSSSNGNAKTSNGEPIPKKGGKMISKYSYKANPTSPLGHELDMKQGEYFKFVEVDPRNSAWWVAENEQGQLGFVPASYMKSMAVTSLPWLQNRQPEPEEVQKPNNRFGVTNSEKPYKPYQSTYSHPEIESMEKETKKREFYCDVCEKDFNGIRPYQAHMASKGHKEEVAYKAEGY